RWRFLDWQLSTVVDDEGADQVEHSGSAEEHQRQEVASRYLDDHADDDGHENARDISSEVHDAAEDADAPSVGQCGRNAPIESPPTRKEQRAGEERARSFGAAAERKEEGGQGGEPPGNAENGTHDDVRRAASLLPGIRKEAA